MTTALACRACGGEPRAGARFCDACGAPLEGAQPPAEYKQVTVLFADVVRSMELAAALGPERLREIMAELLDRSTATVTRYGGTIDKFTGDGIMAVFGAPIALEDHAFRACLAAVEMQRELGAFAQIRIGLSSGQVIAGEIGSTAGSYTAIGEQVGLAERMQSAAPPGGILLSESTARLVETAASLGDRELVHIKNSDEPVAAYVLVAVGRHGLRRSETPLVGRNWELNTITALLDEAMTGAGCVVNIVGPPGIGKSRLAREAAAVAAGRGLPVVRTHCESHAREVPFHALARLLRSATEVDDLDAETARAHIRNQFADATPDDLALLDDILGIRDSAAELPDVAPEARRRRLTALINSASLEREETALYIIEDAHWIDEVSESLLAEFLAIIPHTSAMTLITYRPEYRGALANLSGAQTIALRPLKGSDARALTDNLLGANSSLASIATTVADRAAGNPFFAEEMVRDLAERGVLVGRPGAYRLRSDGAQASVPPTLQATLGARIDRLRTAAKRTLYAASVIGIEFDVETLEALVDTADVSPLIESELVDQVRFTPQPVFAFRHPMIRSVAYEAQLKAHRAELHRRLAALIEQRTPKASEENAALIAEHYESAGDLRAAFDWHMRAGAWANNRDNLAAATSWQRAQRVADRLPDDDPGRLTMRIAPRTLLCATGFRILGSGFSTGFDELRELCTTADDRRSLAVAMSGPVMEAYFNGRRREASALATEHVRLLEAMGDTELMLALITAPMSVKHETAEVHELLRLSQHAVALAGDDPSRGGDFATSSPLAYGLSFRGLARWCLGFDGWSEDFDRAYAMVAHAEPVNRGGVIYYTYTMAALNGVVRPTEAMDHEMAEVLAAAELSGGDVAVGLAKSNIALWQLRRGGKSVEYALKLLAEVRELTLRDRYSRTAIPMINAFLAEDRMRRGDLDGAIELARTVAKEETESGAAIFVPMATGALVNALLQRGTADDLREAESAIDRIAAVPIEPGIVLYQIWLLRMRALLAQANDDRAAYIDWRDRYRKMAHDLGFEGHIAWAEAMN
jgi:adenylate cyclase